MERAQLHIAGYGVKAFTLSMVQAAITVSDGRVPARVIGELVDMGMDMLVETVRLLPGVPEVLEDVGRDHRLVLITKGDLVHQTRKVTTSGLDHHFEHVQIVLEKDADTYLRILHDVTAEPARFCMVGNSVRSDVLPVLSIGGHAVHIPYPLLWEHEHVDHDEDLDELASITELPALLRKTHS
jgi:putative hydrolase of the HAD superfamily